MTDEMLKNLSFVLPFGALLVSFFALRVSGKRMRAEHKQAWLIELRKNIAELYSELAPITTNLDPHSPVTDLQVNDNRITFLVEHLSLMLRERGDDKYEKLRNLVVGTALETNKRNYEMMPTIYKYLQDEAEKVLREESKAIEDELKSIL